jgi:excisionase family DNA binding protein
MQPMALKLHPQRSAQALPQLVDIDDLAAHLGVSIRHIRRLVSERRIPFHKWGRLLRFDVREVVDWLDAARVDCDDAT